MDKNMAVPSTSNLNAMKTAGIQSMIFSIRCIGSLDNGSSRVGSCMDPTTILFVAAATVPKRSPGSQTQIRPKNSGSDDGHGDFAREILVQVAWRSIRFPCISVAHDDEAP